MTPPRKDIKNVSASINQRLLNLSQERRTTHNDILAAYGSERFLYRLGQTDAGHQMVLKGAALLRVWTGQEFRPTRDVDLLGHGSQDHAVIRRIVTDATAVPCPEDGLRFNPDSIRIEDIRGDQEYQGVRVKMESTLGAARIPLQVDIGFGDVVTPAPVEGDYPTLLDLPAPRLLMYPRETAVAEKFEAMVRLGPVNSRMKDFWDVAVLARQFGFEGAVLRQAIKATFGRRQTAITMDTPEALQPAYYQDEERLARWRTFQRQVAPDAPAPTTFDAVGELLRSFLGPVRDSIAADTVFEATWPPGGPWKTMDNDR
ncbi:MAG: nucleotidyl transferase AbiEii/AbiGii toxin family protein [Candidatus Hydrogenedentes bacterium]|nr:nucleotidyl transferase AbiEii/AbiGii toxin family protein [Candidatus Hydrogenedentota bacterium]